MFGRMRAVVGDGGVVFRGCLERLLVIEGVFVGEGGDW